MRRALNRFHTQAKRVSTGGVVKSHASKRSKHCVGNISITFGFWVLAIVHPYKQVKDLRSKYETSDPEGVLDGNLDPFINDYPDYSLGTYRYGRGIGRFRAWQEVEYFQLL